MSRDQKIFLVAQKDAKLEEPSIDDIFKIGTICHIKQFVKLPGDHLRVLVEGEKRAKLISFLEDEKSISGGIELIDDIPCNDDKECEAYKNSIDRAFDEYIEISGENINDILSDLEEEEYVDIVML
jgi:ATP-dependent Lon protease